MTIFLPAKPDDTAYAVGKRLVGGQLLEQPPVVRVDPRADATELLRSIRPESTPVTPQSPRVSLLRVELRLKSERALTKAFPTIISVSCFGGKVMQVAVLKANRVGGWEAVETVSLGKNATFEELAVALQKKLDVALSSDR